VKTKEGEKAELPTMGEIAEIKKMSSEQDDAVSKRTLKIWDVPTELANKFIAVAKGRYANKSWLYLQDIMRKADQYDLMISSGRLDDLESRVLNLEESASRINKVLVEAQEEEIKTEAKKVPRTFGDVSE